MEKCSAVDPRILVDPKSGMRISFDSDVILIILEFLICF